MLLPAMTGAYMGWRAASRKGKTMRLRGTSTAMRRRSSYLATRYRPRRKRLSRRRWQAKARRQVAVPRNYSTSKTTESILPNSSQVLYQSMAVRQLITISKGTDINQRLRDSCVISGIKLDLSFKNDVAKRCFVNWAVIHPKQDQLVTPVQSGFFRDYDDKRSWDADDDQKTGLSWTVAQINADDYVVLKRGKFMLTPQSALGSPLALQPESVSFNSKDSEKSISCYVKLSRTFTWNDNVPQACNDPIYFVCWVASPNDPAGYNIGSAGITYRLRSVIYFREPKSG